MIHHSALTGEMDFVGSAGTFSAPSSLMGDRPTLLPGSDVLRLDDSALRHELIGCLAQMFRYVIGNVPSLTSDEDKPFTALDGPQGSLRGSQRGGQDVHLSPLSGLGDLPVTQDLLGDPLEISAT